MQPPNDPPPSAGRWVSLDEACRILGHPPTTLRRLIRQGRVIGEQEPRGEGDSRVVWRVWVTDAPPDPPSSADSKAPDLPPPAIDLAEAIAAATEPLAERLSVADRQIAAQGETIRAQGEAIADLRERAATAETRAASLQEQLAAERERRERAEMDARRPWWRRLW